MGKQKSFIRIEGTIGGVSFFKDSEGYKAREKGGVNKNRIAKDPKYARTRENMSEFSEAAKSARVLRDAFSELIKAAKEKTGSRRLTKLMAKILRTDTTGLRGQRKVSEGDTALLEGFEFNANSRISEMLGNTFTSEIDRVAGTLSASIPSFVPKQKLTAPEGTTHFKLVSGGAAVDFASGAYAANLVESPMFAWDMNATGIINLVCNVTANSPHPLFLVLGIQFFQEINGNMYPLLDNTSNALTIIKEDSL
jgi:hypothetical protein